MSVRFNPPPQWQIYLPTDFQPATDWEPQSSWDRPTTDWPLWIDSSTGLPSDSPVEYKNNPALCVFVDTQTSVTTSSKTGAAVESSFSNVPGNVAKASHPQGFKKPAFVRPRNRILLILALAVIAAGAVLLGTLIFGEQGPRTTAHDAGTSGQTSAEPEVQASLLGNENALFAAENYLSFGSFSQKALQKQLEIDGYTVDEASSALSHVTADWNKQAINSANEMLKYGSYSRNGLTKQLEANGFTNEQSTQALDHVTADWNEQAKAFAKDALEHSTYSRQGLLDHLVVNGFSRQQAEHGVSEVGF